MITITWYHPRNQNYITCIALLVTADQATVTFNMYRKFSKVRTYGFWDMWADRQTNIQALHCNVSQPYRGGVTSKAAVQFCGWLNVLQVFDATSSEAFQLFTTLAGKVIQSVMSVRPLVRLFVFTVAFKLTDPLPWFFCTWMDDHSSPGIWSQRRKDWAWYCYRRGHDGMFWGYGVWGAVAFGFKRN